MTVFTDEPAIFLDSNNPSSNRGRMQLGLCYKCICIKTMLIKCVQLQQESDHYNARNRHCYPLHLFITVTLYLHLVCSSRLANQILLAWFIKLQDNIENISSFKSRCLPDLTRGYLGHQPQSDHMIHEAC